MLHQAALGSVPRFLNDPITTNAANITGFLNMLLAARDAGVKSFIYAASSSTYGDHPALPKVEENIGKPLSPYAVTTYVNELYAEVFARSYGFKAIGLRYFNLFGKRQDPNGVYAAVIPKWTAAMMRGEDVFINGDGEISRYFCFIENAVQANLLAATAEDSPKNEVYNVALVDRTPLNDLFAALNGTLAEIVVVYDKAPVYRDFRPGMCGILRLILVRRLVSLGMRPRIGFEKALLRRCLVIWRTNLADGWVQTPLKTAGFGGFITD